MESWLYDFILLSGGWAYALLFLVVFLETGCVLTPFFPGDSLLFAIGSYAAMPESFLEIRIVFPLLFASAILGNQVNYFLGKWFGQKMLISCRLNPNYIEKANAFYARHGITTVFLARFLPIIRTFVPFVAGLSNMSRREFLICNFLGGFCWIGIFIGLGYFFGSLPVVKEHFSLVMVFIIAVSLLPSCYSVWISRHSEP